MGPRRASVVVAVVGALAAGCGQVPHFGVCGSDQDCARDGDRCLRVFGPLGSEQVCTRSCSATIACDAGEICSSVSGSTGVIAEYCSLRCMDDPDCPEGFFCFGEPGSPPGSCYFGEIEEPVPAYGYCGIETPCLLPSQTCMPLPGGFASTWCTTAGCARDEDCAVTRTGAPGRCATLPAGGTICVASCTVDADCAASQVCADRLEPGVLICMPPVLR